MNRQALTDDSGHWFDKDSAQRFEEDTNWNGNNNISVATGSQWNHETLFRTASKRWVLHWWSQYQGSLETYEMIDDANAAIWLSRNDRTHPDAENAIADLEL